MIPDIVTTLIMIIFNDGVLTEPKYFELPTIDMMSLAFTFTSIGNFCTYILTSPYYLFKSIHTKYTTYKESGIREFYAWKINREKYDKEIETLAKYESFAENSYVSIDTTTEKDQVYYEFMKSYLEMNIKILKTKQKELELMNIKYFTTRRETILTNYQNRIAACEQILLPTVNTFLQEIPQIVAFHDNPNYPLMEDKQQYKAIITREFDDQKAELLQRIRVLEKEAVTE